MPNHVTSRCTITGPADEIARFRGMMIVTKMEERGELWPADRQPKPHTEFDFDAIIPMPQSLRDVVEGTAAKEGMALIAARGDRGAPFATLGLYDAQIARIREDAGLESDANISDVAAAFLEKNPQWETEGRARMAALLETGFSSWYPWSIENWGTKWGAYGFHAASDDPLIFEFQTAWNFPTPVFEKLAQEFPTLTFDCVCFDEGWNFAGIGAFGATGEPFQIVKATDELYETVYGRKPEPDDEDETESAA